MNVKLHNALGYVGCLLICGALGWLHPALAVGFVGLVIVACGVWLAKIGYNGSIELRVKPDGE